MKFEELKTFLNQDYNLNYWSDHAIDIASGMIEGFDEKDWKILYENYSLQLEKWQIKLAEAIFGINDLKAVHLLVKMLDSHYIKVATAAAESLESMNDYWKPDEALKPKLNSLLEKVSEVDKITINNLINSITKNPN